MQIFLSTLHVIVCLILILVVLLQHGKGADMGAILGGGGGNTVFGSRGAGNFLTKLTTACAILFMLTSLTLSYLATEASDQQLFEAGYEEPLEGDTADGAAGVVEGEVEGTSTEALDDVSELEEIPFEPPSEGEPSAP